MATLLKDTFTDVNGTSLAVHTMDTGGGWSGGVYQVQSNQAQWISGGAIATADATVADVTLTCDLGSADGHGMILRWTDDTHCWMARDNGGTVQLYEFAGAVTLRASTAGATTGAYTISVTTAGATITATVGSTVASYNAATSNQSATRFGLYGGSAALWWDNFLVTAPDAGPATPPALQVLLASWDNQVKLVASGSPPLVLLSSVQNTLTLLADPVMAPEQTLRIIRNQDLTLRFKMQPPQDVTGWSITFKLRPSLTGAASFTKTVGSGVTLTYPGKGVIDVTLAAADTAALTVTTGLATGLGYVWELTRTDAGNRLVLARGNLILEQEIV